MTITEKIVYITDDCKEFYNKKDAMIHNAKKELRFILNMSSDYTELKPLIDQFYYKKDEIISFINKLDEIYKEE